MCITTFDGDFDTQYLLFQWFPLLPRTIRYSCGLCWTLSLLYIFAMKSEPGKRKRLILKNLIINTIVFSFLIVSKVLEVSDSLLYLPAIIVLGIVCGLLVPS